MIKVDILRCNICRSLTVGIGGAGFCAHGCPGHSFALIKQADIPEIGIIEAYKTINPDAEKTLLFTRGVIEHFGDGWPLEMDLDDFLSLAQETGVIRWETYNPEIHGEIDVDPGEEIWLSNIRKSADRGE